MTQPEKPKDTVTIDIAITQTLNFCGKLTFEAEKLQRYSLEELVVEELDYQELWEPETHLVTTFKPEENL